MTLTKQQIAAIEAEYAEFEAQQYAGKSKEERQQFGQFFTPPVLSIRMLEKFDSVKDKDVLDPTVGAGGLLAAAILAGADPKRVYGIELDPVICQLARKRLVKLGVPPKHIKVANALDSDAYNDFDNYKDDCDTLAAAQLKKMKKEAAKTASSEGKPIKKKAVVKSEPKLVKTTVAKIVHDQNALSLKQLYGKLEVYEVFFPAKLGKKLSVKDGKKPDLKKLSKELADKVKSGYWLICDEDVKSSLDFQFAMNDITNPISNCKLLLKDLDEIEKLADSQKLNSFNDIKKLSD